MLPLWIYNIWSASDTQSHPEQARRFHQQTLKVSRKIDLGKMVRKLPQWAARSIDATGCCKRSYLSPASRGRFSFTKCILSIGHMALVTLSSTQANFGNSLMLQQARFHCGWEQSMDGTLTKIYPRLLIVAITVARLVPSLWLEPMELPYPLQNVRQRHLSFDFSKTVSKANKYVNNGKCRMLQLWKLINIRIKVKLLIL